MHEVEHKEKKSSLILIQVYVKCTYGINSLILGQEPRGYYYHILFNHLRNFHSAETDRYKSCLHLGNI